MLNRGRSIVWLESHCKSSGLRDNEIGSFVLISMGMATDDDGVIPGSNESGDVRAENWLTEDGAAEDVSDGSVRRSPHFLRRSHLIFKSEKLP